MKKRLFSLLFAASLCISLSACGSTGMGNKSETAASDFTASKSYSSDTGVASYDIAENGEVSPEAAEFSGIRENAKLIMRADLTIESQEFDNAISAIQKLTQTLGGYIESSGQYGETGYRTASYTVRVPQEKFEAFLTDAGEIGQVTAISQSAEDIADQYSDLETHLKTLKTKHERLIVLLDNASTMEDIISLETALSETEYQIDSISGTLHNYDSLVNFSTISIEIEEVQSLSALSESNSFGSQLKKAAKSGFQAFSAIIQGIILTIVSLWPFLILCAILIPIILRILKRRKIKKAELDKELSAKLPTPPDSATQPNSTTPPNRKKFK